jgi:hypothetical protein
LLVPWQSPSTEQAVLHADALAQTKPPGHGVVLPAAQVPDPVHVRAPDVSCPLLHEGPTPQLVAAEACSHTPPAAHLPSLPQGGFGEHWPAGAAVPTVMLPHVPVARPVSDIVHAWHVPLHAVLQQIWLPAGPMQLPSRHWALAVHVTPSGRSAQVVLPWQKPLVQSAAAAQP